MNKLVWSMFLGVNGRVRKVVLANKVVVSCVGLCTSWFGHSWLLAVGHSLVCIVQSVSRVIWWWLYVWLEKLRWFLVANVSLCLEVPLLLVTIPWFSEGMFVVKPSEVLIMKCSKLAQAGAAAITPSQLPHLMSVGFLSFKFPAPQAVTNWIVWCVCVVLFSCQIKPLVV